MTEDQYISYFLEGDESKKKGRGAKDSVNLLVFSDKILEIIGDSSLEHFQKGEQNAIYRWLRGEMDRWMYCPPNDHDEKRGNGGLLEDPKTSTNTADYEMFEVEMRDWDTGEIMRDKDGSPKLVKTSKCDPGSGVIEAMNELQRTQWEVNLDLLATSANSSLIMVRFWIQD